MESLLWASFVCREWPGLKRRKGFTKWLNRLPGMERLGDLTMAILTVSREFGSGGQEIGQAVASLNGYEYIDKQKIMSDISRAGHKWEEWSRELDESRPSIWERFDWSFRGFGALIQSVILEYAARDNVVIMGRGGNWVLKGVPHALRIHVVAPMEVRVERIMARDAVDMATARWLAEKTDRERSGFCNALYGGRWDDPSEYDMVFDTGFQPLEDVVSIVRELLVARERRNTPQARKSLEMKAAAGRIKAGLLTNPRLFIPTLDADYDGSHIVLEGIIHNPREHDKVEREARKLAGDLPILCRLHYRG